MLDPSPVTDVPTFDTLVAADDSPVPSDVNPPADADAIAGDACAEFCPDVPPSCPRPILLVAEGSPVEVGATVHLHSHASIASTGAIRSVRWTVSAPVAGISGFVPSDTFTNPTFELLLPGTYEFCLDACDDAACSDDDACGTTDCMKVDATATPVLRCVLTWKTPGDFNEQDEGLDAGSDLDLHLLHPRGSGPDIDKDGQPDGWFDIPWDTFAINPAPDLSQAVPPETDAARLDREDDDGRGPEVVVLEKPADGRTYRVGVHYWDDHGYGFAYPRLVCAVMGLNLFDVDLEALGQKMFVCDFWDAFSFDWPTGKATAVSNPDGTLRILHSYVHPVYEPMGTACGP